MTYTAKGVAILFLISGFAVAAIQEPEDKLSFPSIPSALTYSSPTDTLEWHRPRFTEREDERHRLVNTLQSRENIDAPGVLEAMRNVPRHLFVPENRRNRSYENTPLPIGHGQTISQPFIVAFMTEMLNIEPGDKVLEIGTGSGYQAAVLSELTPHVYTIEIIEPLGKSAAERFEKLDYRTIKTKTGDGYFGWEEHAPFDAIIVTAAAGHIPPPLIEQLKPGGVMAIPIGNPYQPQVLVRAGKKEDGSMRTRRLLPVRFVPMTGKALE